MVNYLVVKDKNLFLIFPRSGNGYCRIEVDILNSV